MAIQRPDPFTFTHSLAYVYLFMAHHGDPEGITESEIKAIVLKIGEWNVQFNKNAASTLEMTLTEVQGTLRYFAALTEDEEVSELALHVALLSRMLPNEKTKQAMVADMIAVAAADGKITTVEQALVVKIHEMLGLPAPR